MEKPKHNYKKLEIYQRGLYLASQVLELVDTVRPFRLGEQLAASCVSIPSNISEGSERGTDKEFHRFLEYSCGSSAELETQLVIEADWK